MPSSRWPFLSATLVLCAVLMSLPAMASSGPLPAELINDLRLGGYVIVLRHGATISDLSDSMSRKNVPAQRQLNEGGVRRQNRSEGRCAN